MTALVRHEDDMDIYWGASLAGNEGDGFQWKINLESFLQVEGHHILEVTNRGWCLVGPEFPTRKEGSRYLGFEPGHKGDTSKNWDRLIEEYNSLFSDEIETSERFHPENKTKFGRPSQGRTERMQFSATPELRKWLEGQIKPGENVSLVTFRLLENLRKGD